MSNVLQCVHACCIGTVAGDISPTADQWSSEHRRLLAGASAGRAASYWQAAATEQLRQLHTGYGDNGLSIGTRCNAIVVVS